MGGRAFSILAAALAFLLCAADKPLKPPPLLEAAVQNWLAGKEEWAFTQRMRSLDDNGRVKEEQVSRYDPSLPDSRRWQLLEWNGKPPTPEKRAAWEKARNSKPRKHPNKPLDELFDLGDARLMANTGEQATYRVPVRSDAARLIQVEKLDIEVAIGRETKAIERVTAGIREPMKVALGLATVTGLELDVRFDPAAAADGSAPGDAPAGTARASVSKLGDRIEYEWSDFKRVSAYGAPPPAARAGR